MTARPDDQVACTESRAPSEDPAKSLATRSNTLATRTRNTQNDAHMLAQDMGRSLAKEVGMAPQRTLTKRRAP